MSSESVPPVPSDAPKTGEVYRHYKGDHYKVTGIALDSVTDTYVVLYEPLYEAAVFNLFSRPLVEWREFVEWEGVKVTRFVKV